MLPAPLKVTAFAPEMTPPRASEVVAAGVILAGPFNTIGASMAWLPVVTAITPPAMPLSSVIVSLAPPVTV